MKIYNLAEELEKERKKNKELENKIDFLIDRNDEKQEVIDKVRKYIESNVCLQDEEILNYILKLLEEIE